jgi:hypothetical protein
LATSLLTLLHRKGGIELHSILRHLRNYNCDKSELEESGFLSKRKEGTTRLTFCLSEIIMYTVCLLAVC